jgi:hypothetical protein
LVLLVSIPSYSQNQVLGEVQFVGKTKTEKTSGVWIDGQYVGYAGELKDDKKVLLLPGEHEISVRHFTLSLTPIKCNPKQDDASKAA